MALCDLDEVKLYLGIETDTSDALLDMLIDNASAFIENYTNRIFEVQEYTEIRNGTNSPKMPVGFSPITEVLSVKMDDVDVTDYKNSDTMVWLSNGKRFSAGLMNIELVYEAGFEIIPYDVKQACIELVAYKFKEKDRIGLNSKTLAGEVISFEKREIRESVLSTLAPYVRVV